jgi:hypothetical protein
MKTVGEVRIFMPVLDLERIDEDPLHADMGPSAAKVGPQASLQSLDLQQEGRSDSASGHLEGTHGHRWFDD